MNLYVRISKTASTSISRVLDSTTLEVASSEKYIKRFQAHSYEFKFTFVRNPYDRLVSAYKMLTDSKSAESLYSAEMRKEMLGISFPVFLQKTLEFRETFAHYDLRKVNGVHARPTRLKRWLHRLTGNDKARGMLWVLAHTESMSDKVRFFMPVEQLDFVGRYENLFEDIGKLGDHIKLSRPIPSLNTSRNKTPTSKYYDDETRALVTKLYAEDLDRFGYAWPDQ